MTRLIVLAEGHSEQMFCETLLWSELAAYGEKRVTKLNTNSSQQGRSARGGHGHRFAIIERNLDKLLRSGFDVVTTMIDLYHLPGDFPGLKEAAKMPDPIARAQYLEAELQAHMGTPKALVPNSGRA